jgi:hypothetical protein
MQPQASVLTGTGWKPFLSGSQAHSEKFKVQGSKFKVKTGTPENFS